MSVKLSPDQRREVERLYPMAGLIARRFDSYLYDDLHGVATEALCKAVIKYDPARGVKIETFAFSVMRNAVSLFLTRERMYEQVCKNCRPITNSDDPHPLNRLPPNVAALAEQYYIYGRSSRVLADEYGMTRDRMYGILRRLRLNVVELLNEGSKA